MAGLGGVGSAGYGRANGDSLGSGIDDPANVIKVYSADSDVADTGRGKCLGSLCNIFESDRFKAGLCGGSKDGADADVGWALFTGAAQLFDCMRGLADD